MFLRLLKNSFLPILIFFVLTSVISAEKKEEKKEIVLINKTKAGTGATEEQAAKVYEAFLSVMKNLESVEVRTSSVCSEPCNKPNFIISTELRIQEPFIAVYFRILNRKKGLAGNVQRIRMKDAKLKDILKQLTPENVLPLFDFIDKGAYSKSKIIKE